MSSPLIWQLRTSGRDRLRIDVQDGWCAAAARSDRERFGEAARGFEDLISDAAAMVGTRSRANRDRTSASHVRCRASERIRVPARPAQHVHRGVPDR
jgi:hypothetical protein